MITVGVTTVEAIIDVRISTTIDAKIAGIAVITATGTAKAPPLSSGASSAAFLCLKFQ
jgi:hypothetical protein